MKITNKDILDILKLQKGDSIILDNTIKARVNTNDTIELIESNIICPVTQLINREVTKVEKSSTKKIGDQVCGYVKDCIMCPLQILDCTTLINMSPDDTLYENLENIKPELDRIHENLYKAFKEVLNKPMN